MAAEQNVTIIADVSQISDTSTVAEVRRFLGDAIKRQQSATCPCCQSPLKVYVRRLDARMAADLVVLHRRGNKDGTYTHVPTILSRSPGDFAKLRYWQLIEAMPDVGKRNHGFYRITEAGRQFVMGATRVLSKVRICNGRALGFEGEQVTITDCIPLNEYQKLISSNE